MHTQAEITYEGETMLVRAIVTFKGREHRILGPIDTWNGDRWVEIEDEGLVYEAECALIDAYNPAAEAAGDWRIP